MNEWAIAGATAGLAGIAGICLGVFFFGGLWLTVSRLPSSGHPVLLILASFFGRIIITMAGFYFISDGELARLVAALAGFLIARQIIVQRQAPKKEKEPGDGLKEAGR